MSGSDASSLTSGVPFEATARGPLTVSATPTCAWDPEMNRCTV